MQGYIHLSRVLSYIYLFSLLSVLICVATVSDNTISENAFSALITEMYIDDSVLFSKPSLSTYVKKTVVPSDSAAGENETYIDVNTTAITTRTILAIFETIRGEIISSV